MHRVQIVIDEIEFCGGDYDRSINIDSYAVETGVFLSCVGKIIIAVNNIYTR